MLADPLLRAGYWLLCAPAGGHVHPQDNCAKYFSDARISHLCRTCATGYLKDADGKSCHKFPGTLRRTPCTTEPDVRLIRVPAQLGMLRVLCTTSSRGVGGEGLPNASHARARTEAGCSHTPDVFTRTQPYAKAFYLFLPPLAFVLLSLLFFFFSGCVHGALLASSSSAATVTCTHARSHAHSHAHTHVHVHTRDWARAPTPGPPVRVQCQKKITSAGECTAAINIANAALGLPGDVSGTVKTAEVSSRPSGCYAGCFKSNTGYFCGYFNTHPTGAPPDGSDNVFCAGPPPLLLPLQAVRPLACRFLWSAVRGRACPMHETVQFLLWLPGHA